MVTVKDKVIKKLICIISISIMMILGLFLCNNAYAAEQAVKAPRINGDISMWDCVYFGNYPQTSSGGKAPIRWMIIRVNGNDATLVAEKKLDIIPYYTANKSVNWAGSSLKTWLNGTFYNAAFTSSEKGAIYTTSDGNVHIPSMSEVTTASYGFIGDTSRSAINTDYVSNKYVKLGNGNISADLSKSYGAYWLRESSNASGYINAVRGSGWGKIDNTYQVTSNGIGVRPQLHLNLSSSYWRYAGKKKSNGSTVPTAPANLSVSRINTNTASLNWSSSWDADGYEIYRTRGTTTEFVKEIANVSTTSWSQSGLAGNTTYKYKVRAYWNTESGKSYSSFTPEVSVTIPYIQQSQQITCQSEFTKTYGNAAFNLNASAKTTLSYSSSNTNVITVSSTGLVTIKNPGTATITIKAAENSQYKGASKTVTITVKKAAQSIGSKYSGTITKTCSATSFSLNATSKTSRTYTTSNSYVATVTSSGYVKVKNPGTAVITIKAASTSRYYGTSKKITIKARLKAPKVEAYTGKYKHQIRVRFTSVYSANEYVVKRYRKGYTPVSKYKVKRKPGTSYTYLVYQKNSKGNWVNPSTLTIKKGAVSIGWITDLRLTLGRRYYYKVEAKDSGSGPTTTSSGVSAIAK